MLTRKGRERDKGQYRDPWVFSFPWVDSEMGFGFYVEIFRGSGDKENGAPTDSRASGKDV